MPKSARSPGEAHNGIPISGRDFPGLLAGGVMAKRSRLELADALVTAPARKIAFGDETG
jgi:hypothetical protein